MDELNTKGADVNDFVGVTMRQNTSFLALVASIWPKKSGVTELKSSCIMCWNFRTEPRAHAFENAPANFSGDENGIKMVWILWRSISLSLQLQVSTAVFTANNQKLNQIKMQIVKVIKFSIQCYVI